MKIKFSLVEHKKKHKKKTETNFENKQIKFKMAETVVYEKIVADLRSYKEKKAEIKDKELEKFLGNKVLHKRRRGYCDVIDKEEFYCELKTFRENLLREDCIENFLL